MRRTRRRRRAAEAEDAEPPEPVGKPGAFTLTEELSDCIVELSLNGQQDDELRPLHIHS